VVDIQVTEYDPETNKPTSENFYTTYFWPGEQKAVPDTSFDRLVKVWYYAITTLSTIGYGDFHLVSTNERWIASFILMFGVSVFSLIMSQFIEIMMSQKKIWKVGQHEDLTKWIALLSRFNNGHPLNKDLIS
jgi:hypothetical protein